jgi:GNAT superfamily N-acetyltransferase
MAGDLGGLSFRRAGEGDVPALVELRLEFMRLIKDAGGEDEEGWRAELSSTFSAELASGLMVAWICLEAEETIAAGGIAFAAPPDAEAGTGASAGAGAGVGAEDEGAAERRASLALEAGEALIFNMYTRPGWRRRGIATELLRRSVGEGRARGITRFRLQSTPDSRAMYERAGFLGAGEEMLLDVGLTALRSGVIAK